MAKHFIQRTEQRKGGRVKLNLKSEVLKKGAGTIKRSKTGGNLLITALKGIYILQPALWKVVCAGLSKSVRFGV